MQQHLHPQATKAVRTSISTSRPHRHTLGYQGLNKLRHRSSSLSDRCIHISDPFQLRLRPDYTATPTICTKHRDHHDLLVTLSPRTNRQPGLRLSTVPTFNTAETTQKLYSNSDSTPKHTFRVRFVQ